MGEEKRRKKKKKKVNLEGFIFNLRLGLSVPGGPGRRCRRGGGVALGFWRCFGVGLRRCRCCLGPFCPPCLLQKLLCGVLIHPGQVAHYCGCSLQFANKVGQLLRLFSVDEASITE